MMSHKRVDDFMKVAKERVNDQNSGAWEFMYTRLYGILGNSEEGTYLAACWSNWKRERALDKWDCDFTELVIDEAGVIERAKEESKAPFRVNSMLPTTGGAQNKWVVTEQQLQQHQQQGRGLLNTPAFTQQK